MSQVVAAVPWNVFGIGIECCGPARAEGSWHTGKDEGVPGRAAVGGVTKGGHSCEMKVRHGIISAEDGNER